MVLKFSSPHLPNLKRKNMQNKSWHTHGPHATTTTTPPPCENVTVLKFNGNDNETRSSIDMTMNFDPPQPPGGDSSHWRESMGIREMPWKIKVVEPWLSHHIMSNINQKKGENGDSYFLILIFEGLLHWLVVSTQFKKMHKSNWIISPNFQGE